MISRQKDAFFKGLNGLAVTFDDVRIRTAASKVATSEVNLDSFFAKGIKLRVPIISAAMDTVTTSEMAIAMAKKGGLGVINAGLEPMAQREEVRRVKLYLNGLIEKPITFDVNRTVSSVLEECDRRGFHFRTFPVVDGNNKLQGVVTKTDFKFCEDTSITLKRIMTPISQVITVPAKTTPHGAYDIMKKSHKDTIPMVDKTGLVVGLYVSSDVLRIVRDNPNQYNLDKNGRLMVAAAVPTDEHAIERVKAMRSYLDVAVIDSAQGDSRFAIKTLKDLKKKFPDLPIVVGNISEGSSAKLLARAGADGIKVGQGPGSICTTRTETGVGTPQVTAVYECAKAVEGTNVPICADGGIRYPGDISIAIAAGASSVMLGSALAGTKETPGELVMREDGKFVKPYNGMGSPASLAKSAASRARYGGTSTTDPLPEGVEAEVVYKGSVVEVMEHYIKALRKSMSYVGAPTIKAHREETRFWRITNAGMAESKPHDVRVIGR